jgi:hypothetical protein
MIWAAIVVWAILAGALAVFATHWVTKRDQARRLRAYKEILDEKGVAVKPGEPIKRALLRARRQEIGVVSRPPPDFARSVLQRPKSRPDIQLDTRHVSGHTPASHPGFEAVRPRAGLIMPPAIPRPSTHRKA